MDLRVSSYIKIFTLFSILALSGCANFRESKFGKFYHNVTAKYNGYFNARETIKLTEKLTQDSHVDDFSSIVDVFRLGDENTGKANASALDESLEKCKRVIQRHPKSKWVDDSYFEIGRAYFYKAQYYEALDIFKYLANEFKKEEIGKEAQLWIVLCYSQLKKYDEALAFLANIKADKSFPKKFNYKVELLNAHIKIKVGNYDSAIPSLLIAIPDVPKKQDQWRYTFILAQMYDYENQDRKARELYESIKNKNMPYEFQFQTRINISKTIDLTNPESAAIAIKNFKKLLKDDNNIDYFDQIYFEIGQIYQKSKNEEQAILNFEKSSFFGTTENPIQKSNTLLALGDIHFKNKNYQIAGAYYDSCAVIIPENHPKFNSIKNQQIILSELITNLTTIDLQDSLQYLATLNNEQIDAKIEEFLANQALAQQAAEEKKQKQELREQLKQENQESSLNANLMNKGSADWYFYNATSIGLGISDFKNKWGNRKNEDNWRRSDKIETFNNTVDTLPNADEIDDDSLNNEQSVTEYELPEQLKNVTEDKKKYYAQIPFLPSQKKASDDKIIEALFGNGEIYFEKLNNNEQAYYCFNTLINRFPDNKYELPSAYYLYKMGLKSGNDEQKEEYKKLILDKYPKSEYAKLIRGDKFEDKNHNPLLEKIYMETYNNYMEGNCEQALLLYNKAEKEIKENYLKPNFEFFRIMCTYKDGDKKELIDQLQILANNYGDKDAGKNASNVIRYLKEQMKKEKQDSITNNAVSLKTKSDSLVPKKTYIYKYSDVGPFIYVLIADKKDNKIDKINVALSNYNTKYHKLQKLNVRSFILNDEKQLFMITRFSNINDIEKYHKGLSTDKEFKANLMMPNLDMFFTTEPNFRILVKEKDEKEYIEFFAEYYNKK